MQWELSRSEMCEVRSHKQSSSKSCSATREVRLPPWLAITVHPTSTSEPACHVACDSIGGRSLPKSPVRVVVEGD